MDKNISRATLRECFTLSNKSRSPNQVYSAMKRSLRSSLQLTKSEHVVKLFRQLNQTNITLKEVHNVNNKLCKGLKQRRENVNKLIKW